MFKFWRQNLMKMILVHNFKRGPKNLTLVDNTCQEMVGMGAKNHQICIVRRQLNTLLYLKIWTKKTCFSY